MGAWPEEEYNYIFIEGEEGEREREKHHLTCESNLRPSAIFPPPPPPLAATPTFFFIACELGDLFWFCPSMREIAALPEALEACEGGFTGLDGPACRP